MEYKTVSLRVEENIEHGRVAVMGSADRSAKYPAAGAGQILGVFLNTVEAGQSGAVVTQGLYGYVVAGGNVTRGKYVVPTADNEGKIRDCPEAAGTAYECLGKAMASGVAGDYIEVLINPIRLTIPAA